MAKFRIKAFGGEDGTPPTQYATVEAKTRDAAITMAWDIFPEYEDVYVTEIKEQANPMPVNG